MRIETALVLFNRDLRLRDNPALAAAAKEGAWHFWDLLSDGEIANNAGSCRVDHDEAAAAFRAHRGA